MLKEILNLINETNLYSDAFISKKLNIRKDMANDMVKSLIRMGYLIEDLGSPTCQTSCSKCAYARSCNTTPVKTFKISPKGEKLLKAV
ncbi:MAG: FeoC-like transcriptional regulator [Tissierella sp.]|uniref:FeoC-like transcriptional regulator n=1 Tax=Tissierella sp. TaxID=41274 RepID=UPI003F97DBD3